VSRQPATYDDRLDGPRIATLLDCVREVMAGGEWLTLGEIRRECACRGVHGSEAGISARIRDLRKPQHGGREVDRRRRGEPSNGLWEYRLLPDANPGEQMLLAGVR